MLQSCFETTAQGARVLLPMQLYALQHYPVSAVYRAVLLSTFLKCTSGEYIFCHVILSCFFRQYCVAHAFLQIQKQKHCVADDNEHIDLYSDIIGPSIQHSTKANINSCRYSYKLIAFQAKVLSSMQCSIASEQPSLI